MTTNPSIEKASDAFFRYLTINNAADHWGIYVCDLGYTRIGKDSPYPPFEHPETHLLNRDTGRVLQEYQLVYITRGAGTFWSVPSGVSEVTAGSVFLIFPGVRHYYRPDPECGWDEQWIGFSGDHGERIMRTFFEPTNPLLHIGIHPELQDVFLEMCDFARREVFGFRRIIAAKALECVARLQILANKNGNQTSEQENLVRQACSMINAAVEKPFDFQDYASENGISYAAFRRLFKDHTGLPPQRYLLDMRVRKAQAMLSNTTLSVQAVSDETGFENSFYFSRYFKKRTGVSPLNYRKRGQ